MHAWSHYTIKSNCSWINEYWYHTIYQLALLTIKDPLLLGRCKTNNSGPTHLPHGFRTLKKIYRFSFKNVMKNNTLRMVHYKYAILTDYFFGTSIPLTPYKRHIYDINTVPMAGKTTRGPDPCERITATEQPRKFYGRG